MSRLTENYFNRIVPNSSRTVGEQKKKTVWKKSYLKRGRRVRYGRCRHCFEFKLKQFKHRSIIHTGGIDNEYFTDIIVECKHHGRTLLETRKGTWILTEDGIIQTQNGDNN